MDNLKGILFMILAMAGFAFEDLFIKILSADLPDFRNHNYSWFQWKHYFLVNWTFHSCADFS